MDVIVIGAGAAGLAAAEDLVRADLSIVILEARDRLGGRIHTLHDDSIGAPVEFGAEFVHGVHEALWTIVRRARLSVSEVEGDFVDAEGSSEFPGEGMSSYDKLISSAAQLEGRDQSFKAVLDQSAYGAREKNWMTHFVEGFEAAPTDKISLQSLVQEAIATQSIQGERAFRFPGGYDQVVTCLAQSLDSGRATVHLGTAVTEVRWSHGKVEICAKPTAGGDASQFQARAALLTVPLGVLQAPPEAEGAIRFVPEIPNTSVFAPRLAMGLAVRITLVLEEPVWKQSARFKNLGFLFSRDPVMPTWWTGSSQSPPRITGWAGGPKAEKLKGVGNEVVYERALESLARLICVDARRLRKLVRSWHTHDWSTDPFARGAYTYAPVGEMDASQGLAAPAERTLFFAGEATCSDGHGSTVHGASASGRRAAAEILSSL